MGHVVLMAELGLLISIQVQLFPNTEQDMQALVQSEQLDPFKLGELFPSLI